MTSQLPRGRHGLSREEVVAAQRGRMLRATADAMSENGYANTSVADIIKRAGVSRETFYEQFSSKQDCFVAALEDAITIIASSGAGRAPADGTPRERFSAMLGDYLDILADQSHLARLFLVEIYASDVSIMRRRVKLQEGFVSAVAAVFGAASAEDRFACAALVAAVSSLVTSRLVENDLDGLRALHAPILALTTRLFP